MGHNRGQRFPTLHTGAEVYAKYDGRSKMMAGNLSDIGENKILIDWEL